MEMQELQLERLVDDPEIRRAAAKTLKGFCYTYLPHHFPLDAFSAGLSYQLVDASLDDTICNQAIAAAEKEFAG